MLRSLGELHCRGLAIDWTKLSAGRRVRLPTYAFQRNRFWVETSHRHTGADAVQVQVAAADDGFWSAVESGDLDSLANALNVADEQHKASLASLLPALNSWRRNHQERTTLNAWRYRVAWKPMPTAPSLSSVAGSWLVVVPSEPEDSEIIDAIVQALGSAGGQVVRVAVDES
jgi:polyketide synthase 12